MLKIAMPSTSPITIVTITSNAAASTTLVTRSARIMKNTTYADSAASGVP
ncbi:hypothetical protein BCO18175_00001 [Burkholderia contaminans]|nr:hypothetical protein BCO18175_00001 [Burkholderia contaminans]